MNRRLDFPHWLAGRFGPAGWFCLAVILVFGIRAATTLAGGAGWGTPGSGWRSIWQIAVVLLALVGLVWQRRILAFVAVIGSVYLLASVLELFNGTTLIGAIPVDSRDRLIHPLVAVLAVAVIVVLSLLQRRRANAQNRASTSLG